MKNIKDDIFNCELNEKSLFEKMLGDFDKFLVAQQTYLDEKEKFSKAIKELNDYLQKNRPKKSESQLTIEKMAKNSYFENLHYKKELKKNGIRNRKSTKFTYGSK